MQNTTAKEESRTDESSDNQTKYWGKLSYYNSSQNASSGMIDDPSKVASIDAASSCVACCCIFV